MSAGKAEDGSDPPRLEGPRGGDCQETDSGTVLPSRILVVDDEPVARESVSRTLRRQGHRVDCESRAANALMRLESETYDLVITDLRMPGLDGLEFLELLQLEGAPPPVLAITGYGSLREAVRSLRLGAVDFLPKPFTRAELLPPIQRALRRAQRERPRDPGATGAAEGDPTPVELDEVTAGFRCRLGEHTWACCEQNGSVSIGIERSFLEGVGEVSTIELPVVGETVEQGAAGIWLRNAGNEIHAVRMPLTGAVLEVNPRAALACEVDPDSWLIRIEPNRANEELGWLLRA